MLLGNVVDQFHYDHGLAYACSSEQPGLSTLYERLNQVDDFHSSFKHLCGCRLVVECRRWPMDRQLLRVLYGAKFVHSLANDIHDSTQSSAAYRNLDRAAEISGWHPTNHALGGLHSNATYAAFAQVLLYLEDYVDWSRCLKPVTHHP